MYNAAEFDPALLSLMAVAKKVTPQGQPTVAAQMMAAPQAMPPGQPPGQPPGMPPGMPPGQPPGMPPAMPPQGIAQSFPAVAPQGMQGALTQSAAAAPSVAMLMQPQIPAGVPPQPPMMADGGIASLPVGMDGYADGGIIGYAGGGMPKSTIEGLFDLFMSSNEYNPRQGRYKQEEPKPAESAKPTLTPALFQTDDTDPVRRVNQLVNILRSDQTLDPANRTRIAQEINKLYAQINAAPQDRQPSAAPPEAGIPSAMPPQRAPSGLSDLFSKSEAALKEMRTPEEKTPQQIAQKRIDYLRSMGLPTDAGAAEETRLKELEAFDAETRAGIPGRQKAQMQNALLQGILNPPRKPMHIGELLAGTGSALGTEEEKIARESEASRGKQREQMIAMATARRALDAARRQEAMGDYAGAEASRETANAAFNKMQETKINLLGKQAELTAAGERASEMPANMQELMFAIKNPEEYAKAVRAKAGSTAADKLDLAELSKLQSNLTSQLSDVMLPKERKAELQAMLAKVTDRLATMSGISSTGPTGASVKYASNPKTGERIMSTDGGQTWKPAQ